MLFRVSAPYSETNVHLNGVVCGIQQEQGSLNAIDYIWWEEALHPHEIEISDSEQASVDQKAS